MTGQTIALRLPSLTVEMTLDLDLSTQRGRLALNAVLVELAQLTTTVVPFLFPQSPVPPIPPGGTVEDPVAATDPARSAGDGATAPAPRTLDEFRARLASAAKTDPDPAAYFEWSADKGDSLGSEPHGPGPQVADIPDVAEAAREVLRRDEEAAVAPEPAPKPGQVTPQRARVLSLLADAGGMFDGSAQELLELAGDAAGPTAGARNTLLSGMEQAGLVSIDRKSPRKSTAVRCTLAGWEAIGRRPTDHPGATKGLFTEPAPQPAQAGAPKASEVVAGPIERRPFDADAVRAGSVNGSIL